MEVRIPKIACESAAPANALRVVAGFAPTGGIAPATGPGVVMGTAVPPMGGGGAGGIFADQLTQLAQLHATGVLSDAEFAAAKQKVTLKI